MFSGFNGFCPHLTLSHERVREPIMHRLLSLPPAEEGWGEGNALAVLT
jgi:hypothetical protein